MQQWIHFKLNRHPQTILFVCLFVRAANPTERRYIIYLLVCLCTRLNSVKTSRLKAEKRTSSLLFRVKLIISSFPRPARRNDTSPFKTNKKKSNIPNYFNLQSGTKKGHTDRC